MSVVKEEMLYKELQILYEASGIPMYLCKEGNLLMSFPGTAALFGIPEFLTEGSKEDILKKPILKVHEFAVYGRIPLHDDKDCLLIAGPVAEEPYTQRELQVLCRDYHIELKDQIIFVTGLRAVPSYTSARMAGWMKLLHHVVNKDHPEIRFVEPTEDRFQEQVLSQGMMAAVEATDADETNNSLEYEEMLMDIIERGDIEAMRAIDGYFFDFRSGTLADTYLRNHKNLCHTGLTLAARAAIRGGLDPQAAFQMSDRYIQQLEMAHNREELVKILLDGLMSYTQMVAERRLPDTPDKLTKEVILYIREHVSTPLTIPGLSAHFGYSRDYLSQKFKKQIGIGLQAFILKSRLEEACRLLTYTSMSLKDISDHLCFSSQSHFQNAFKKAYDMTPAAFREDKRKIRLYMPE